VYTDYNNATTVADGSSSIVYYIPGEVPPAITVDPSNGTNTSAPYPTAAPVNATCMSYLFYGSTSDIPDFLTEPVTKNGSLIQNTTLTADPFTTTTITGGWSIYSPVAATTLLPPCVISFSTIVTFTFLNPLYESTVGYLAPAYSSVVPVIITSKNPNLQLTTESIPDYGSTSASSKILVTSKISPDENPPKFTTTSSKKLPVVAAPVVTKTPGNNVGGSGGSSSGGSNTEGSNSGGSNTGGSSSGGSNNGGSNSGGSNGGSSNSGGSNSGGSNSGGSNGGSSGSSGNNGGGSGTNSGSGNSGGNNGGGSGTNGGSGSSGGNPQGSSNSGSSSGNQNSGSQGSNGIGNSGGAASAPSTVTVGGIPVVLSPGNVVINGQTITASASSTVVFANGQPFTINPSQVIAPGTTVARPVATGAGASVAPTPTTIGGIPILLSPSVVVLNGATYAYGSAASQITTVVNGQSVSIGPDGIGLKGTTLQPSGSLPTSTVILGGVAVTQIGSNIAIVGGDIVNYGSEISPQTRIVNGQSVIIGPSVVSVAGTTLAPPSQPSATQVLTAGGVAVTEINSNTAIIDGTTIIIGPGITSSSVIVDGHTISIGPGGIAFAGTTLAVPLNGQATQVLSHGGITFTEIGSTLAVISGTTFKFGVGSTATSKVINGQTISIGPGGIGFASTTFEPQVGAIETGASIVTAGGITFTEISGSIAIIDGTTFTFGVAGAKTTTDVVGSVTISIGPDGLGFASTTIGGTGTSATPSTTGSAATQTSKKSEGLQAVILTAYWVELCIAFGVGLLVL
jgi:hypothetical protein